MQTKTQPRLEVALLILVGLAAAGTIWLQYRWTDELDRAERSRLRGNLEGYVRRIVRSFDHEIQTACRALLPDAGEIKAGGTAAAHRTRYVKWVSDASVAGLFQRIEVAIPEHGELRLYVLDSDGQMQPSNRPTGREPLRASMLQRIAGEGPVPTIPADSDLIEFPVTEDQGRNGGAKLEWMIFEVNRDFIRNRFLRGIAAEYPEIDISVTRTGAPQDVIFSTRRDGSPVLSGADLTAGLFSPNLVAKAGIRPKQELTDPGREHQELAGAARWVLAVRHRSGSLEAAVANAKTRNLLISLLLTGLLAGTASALVRVTARSRRLADMQFRFAAGVSHDLRTPLTAIRGAAYNLANGMIQDPGAVQRYNRLILRNADELTCMVENVLAYTSTLQETKEKVREPLSISALLERTAAGMASEIEAAGCRIEMEIAFGLPSVKGDALSLEQAFRNLIGNAVRHAAAGRWIGVAASASESGVTVQVSDHGPGIPEDEQERIFEPFYRGEQARTGRSGGTGLGLSLARNTILAHGGSIRVRSSPGEGADFTIWFPDAQDIG